MSARDEAVGAASASGEFESLDEIVRKAHESLPKEKWDSLVGGAETETTLKRNRLAIDSIAFKPRVLRNVSAVDLRSSISAGSCDCRYFSPLLVR